MLTRLLFPLSIIFTALTQQASRISMPEAVRYAWADNPEDVNFYNKEGLPASPFTTEK